MTIFKINTYRLVCFIYYYYFYAVKHSEIKDRIIETASSLFYKNGYNSTGINEIISESGIAKATLYSHFRSKDDICLAYLQFKNTTFLEEIEAYTTSKKHGNTQVLALFDFLYQFFQHQDFNGCWCIKTAAEIPFDDQKIGNEIRKLKNDFISLIEKLIIHNLKITKKKKIDSLARKIYLLYESAVSESHIHKEEWPIIEAKKLCSQIIS